jgi:phosphoribosylaminoimidazole-succinocarboxamide synthase
VRNYLQKLVDEGQWHQETPGPELPEQIVSDTSQKYLEAYEKLTGKALG